MHFHRAKHYLQSCVTCQYWRLIVDWYDSHRDGDREAPAINLIRRGRECKTVLGALGAVMHVVDVSKFYLEKTKRIQLSLNSESDLNGRKHHKIGRGWGSLKDGIKFYGLTVSLYTHIQKTLL